MNYTGEEKNYNCFLEASTVAYSQLFKTWAPGCPGKASVELPVACGEKKIKTSLTIQNEREKNKRKGKLEREGEGVREGERR